MAASKPFLVTALIISALHRVVIVDDLFVACLLAARPPANIVPCGIHILFCSAAVAGGEHSQLIMRTDVFKQRDAGAQMQQRSD
jgi:hypothetical protein